MTEFDYLLCDGRSNKRKIEKESFWWHGMGVHLHLVPQSLGGTQRLRRYVEKYFPKRERLWISEELKMPDYRPPKPEIELAAFVYGQQPFREILIIFTDENEDSRAALWEEQFVEDCFRELNGLYFVGNDKIDRTDFFQWMQKESGLVACTTERMPKVDGKRALLVDLNFRNMPAVRHLPSGLIYLDLTSNAEKRRNLKEKRTDISYISVRNYLDTAFKARYNAI